MCDRGTRMPSLFVGGYSGFTDVFGGRAQDQIDAMWAYLSQGEHLPLPDGFTNVAGLQLAVEDEPVVFRTFMTDAGWRAIAVGFPEQLHCAFNGESCRLAVIWQGQFLNAKARGPLAAARRRIRRTSSGSRRIDPCWPRHPVPAAARYRIAFAATGWTSSAGRSSGTT